MQDDFEDWEITPDAQPQAGDYHYDLETALKAVVELEAHVPADAFTAGALGEQRGGNAVQIDESGLLLTIGYLVTEAERVRLRARNGASVDGHVLGVDAASGLALVQALDSLDIPALALGDSRRAGPRTPVVLGGAGGRARSIAAHIVARQEFAGYWEYLIEEAIFTAPAHPNWGGAALIGPQGDLLGIGSLQLQHHAGGGRVLPLNMVVPVELLSPIYEDLKRGRPTRPRPWLGLYAPGNRRQRGHRRPDRHGAGQAGGPARGRQGTGLRGHGADQPGRLLPQHLGAGRAWGRRAADGGTGRRSVRPDGGLSRSPRFPQEAAPELRAPGACRSGGARHNWSH